MMNPLPNVSKAYAMIVSDESQRSTSGMHTGGIEGTLHYMLEKGIIVQENTD